MVERVIAVKDAVKRKRGGATGAGWLGEASGGVNEETGVKSAGGLGGNDAAGDADCGAAPEDCGGEGARRGAEGEGVGEQNTVGGHAVAPSASAALARPNPAAASASMPLGIPTPALLPPAPPSLPATAAPPLPPAAPPAASPRLFLVKWEGLGYDACTWETPEIATEQV